MNTNVLRSKHTSVLTSRKRSYDGSLHKIKQVELSIENNMKPHKVKTITNDLCSQTSEGVQFLEQIVLQPIKEVVSKMILPFLALMRDFGSSGESENSQLGNMSVFRNGTNKRTWFACPEIRFGFVFPTRPTTPNPSIVSLRIRALCYDLSCLG